MGDSPRGAPDEPRFDRDVVIVLVFAFLVRLYAAAGLGVHIDEPETVQAAIVTWERGYPLLPSGVLYLQGTTLSYLLAPFTPAGPDAIELFKWLRLPSVFAGTLAIALGFGVARELKLPQWATLLALGTWAVQPIAVEWSARVRVYGLLQLCSAAVLLLFLRTAAAPTAGRALALAAALFVSVFTHLGALLVWPALALVALVEFRRELLGTHRWLAVALTSVVVPVGVFLLLNRTFGVSTSGRSTGFVGDHLLALSPSYVGLTMMHGLGWKGAAYSLFVAVLGLIGAWRARSFAAWTVVITYVWTIAVFGLLFAGHASRYVLPAQPLAAFMAALGAAALLPATGRRAVWQLALAAAVLSMPVYGLNRLSWSRGDPDYAPSVTWLEQQGGHDPVLASMPPIAWLGLSDRERIVFLAGGTDENGRVIRYTMRGDDGSVTDFWNGVPAITSVAGLCSALESEPRPWLLVDRMRLASDWAFGGDMAAVIRGGTRVVYRRRGAEVRVALPRLAWDDVATAMCP